MQTTRGQIKIRRADIAKTAKDNGFGGAIYNETVQFNGKECGILDLNKDSVHLVELTTRKKHYFVHLRNIKSFVGFTMNPWNYA